MNLSMPTIAMLAISLLSSSPASAFDADVDRQLMRLDPHARLEQTCDTEAMLRIGRDKNAYHPDKVIAWTFHDPIRSGNEIIAPGAVFRSGGHWYHLSYQCVTGPRRLVVKELHYKIGPMISRSAWKTHYLYN